MTSTAFQSSLHPARLSIRRALTSLPAVGVYLFLATLLKFYAWTPTAFFGDDLLAFLDFLDGKLASTIPQALFDSWYDKFRPLVQLYWWATFSAFGTTHVLHIAGCYALHVLCGCLIYTIALRLSGRFVIALAIALIFVTLRFSFLNLIVIGPVESLPLLCLLVALRLSLPLYESLYARHAVWAALGISLATFLAIFGHERYLAMMPWSAAVIVLAPALRAPSFALRAGLSALALAPALLNAAYKTFVLRSKLNIGSGGKMLTFDPEHFGENTLNGLLSIFGINRGHPFWNGHKVESLLDPALWLSLAFIGGLIWLVRRLRRQPGHDPRRVWIFLLIGLGGLMMIPPFLANPLQPRWFLLPAGLLLLILAWMYGTAVRAHDRKSLILVPACLGLYAAADIAISLDYRTFYLVDLSRMTSALARVAPQIPPGRVDTIQAINSWATLNGAFFRIYGGQTREMGYYATKDLWLADPKAGDTAWLYNGRIFTPITRPKP